ncbi:S26 family signal peptidase [Streptomyces sp. GC420]|uniref:S26 family signal peptidase n=1 Tax=Streptomyces sp. GC420 TaxID=2697568 RepID=UPI0014152ECC|nr:S26 family signal peptidase [Streptomyces sp. GC420]NBM14647.1 S26 family signal peptidase [Streptomyces sp. GC420]
MTPVTRLLRRLLRTRLLAVTVTGSSMEPVLHDGDRVLVRRRPRVLAPGSVVVLRPPSPGPDGPAVDAERPGDGEDVLVLRRASKSAPGLLIKRVAAVPGDPVPAALTACLGCPLGTVVPSGRLLVLGDNSDHSVDSRHFGYIPDDEVVGVAVRLLRTRGAGGEVSGALGVALCASRRRP